MCNENRSESKVYWIFKVYKWTQMPPTDQTNRKVFVCMKGIIVLWYHTEYIRRKFTNSSDIIPQSEKY